MTEALISPPLLLGLDVRGISRSATELLSAQRRAAAASVDPKLARAAVRAAHMELAASALSDWLLDLDDERVRLHSGSGARELAAEIAERAAKGLADVARAAATLPWRLDAAAAFWQASDVLGAECDTGALELRFTRSGARIDVRVRFREGAPTTLVRLAFDAGDADARKASDLELDRRVLALEELRGDVQVVGDETVEIRRAGIVASADALVELVDAALGLADELLSEVRPVRGPYR